MAFEAIGGREDEFWTMTPRTYWRRMQAEGERLKRLQDDRTELAWEIATLSRAAKIPKLAVLLRREKPPPMTGEEVMASLRAMTAEMPKRSWKEWLEAQ
jgi:hypothetical protein